MIMINECISMFMKSMNSMALYSCKSTLPCDNSIELCVKALTCVVDDA